MIQDAAPTVVASMLVSPLMGPIVGLTFGFISRDQNIMYLSARSELVVGTERPTFLLNNY
jgi:uncharacterized membrane protein